ncbi:MAG: TonB family protein [Pseudomonadota bacterium]
MATPDTNDRLVSALFAAALVHGLVILGVSFQGLLPNARDVAPSLEVVLVRSDLQTNMSPDDARYLAEQSLSGSGTTTDAVDATSQMATIEMADIAGVADGAALHNQRQQADPDSVRLVASKARSRFAVSALEDPSTDTVRRTERALLMREQVASDELVDNLDQFTQLQSETLRELYVAVDTRQSNVARYLGLWKKKIEQVGTLNFPDDTWLAGLSGNPTLEVAIRSDGALHDIRVRASSNHERIDQAALRIVRLSAPFDPFPDPVRRDYDILRFVYVWEFVDGRRRSGEVRAGDQAGAP